MNIFVEKHDKLTNDKTQIVDKSIKVGSRIIQSLTPSFESIFIAIAVGLPFSLATSEAASVIANSNGEIYIDAFAG